MKLLLSDILKLDIFKDAEIIAGRSGKNNEVSFVTIMDVPNIAEWLHGGEMLLAAGIFEKCCNENFFRSVKRKSVSAIITKYAYASAVDDNIRFVCEELCIPIIAVSAGISWSDIMIPITQLIAKMQYELIYQSQQFHSALMRSLIRGESVAQLCGNIYDMFKLSIAVTNYDFSLMGYSNNIEWNKVMEKFSIYEAYYHYDLGTTINGSKIGGYVYNNYYLSGIGSQIFIFPVSQNHVTYGYVFLLTGINNEKLNASESMKIDQISLVIGINSVKKLEFGHTARRYNNLLLDRILHDNAIDQLERAELEKSLGCKFHYNYYIAIVKVEWNITDIYKQSTIISRLFEAIKLNNADFYDVLCFERSSFLVFFLPGEDRFIKRTAESLFEKCSAMLESKIKIGISESTHDDFIKAYNHALTTLQYIEDAKKDRLFFYEDLGVLRYFIDKEGKLDSDFLDDTKKRYILPLEKYDTEHGTQLKYTVERYIANDCSGVKTQKELFIHKNTLYARLSKIEKLINCRIDSAEDMFNIQLALKLDRQI